MGKIRRSPRQIAAAKLQKERMEKYWAMKHADGAIQAEKIGDFMDKIRPVLPILEKVYMAGWHHNKFPSIKGVGNQMSVQDAYSEIERIFKPL